MLPPLEQCNRTCQIHLGVCHIFIYRDTFTYLLGQPTATQNSHPFLFNPITQLIYAGVAVMSAITFSTMVQFWATLTILSGTFELSFTIECFPHICEPEIFITMLRHVITSHTKLYFKQRQRDQPRNTYTSPLHLSSTHPSIHCPRTHPYRDTAYFVLYHILLYHHK